MPDVIDTSDWTIDHSGAFRRAYLNYRKIADIAEGEIRKRFPCWQVEVREHRSDSFEVMLCPPLADPSRTKVFYLNSEQMAMVLDPDFKASARDFFGFNLLKDEDFKA